MPLTLALRHVAFEDLGTFEAVLLSRGHEVRYVDVPTEGVATLSADDADLLVVLGGPIGAYEDDAYPFLVDETRLVRDRLLSARPILGLCLGAQIIARALGARVYPGTKEIGWEPVTLTTEGQGACLAHLGDAAVLHWHGDTFDLPDGARHLASTAACANQAFAWQSHALALQFHVEAGGKSLERWFVGHTAEIVATPGVTVEQLRADTARYSERIEAAGAACFGAWLDEVGLSG